MPGKLTANRAYLSKKAYYRLEYGPLFYHLRPVPPPPDDDPPPPDVLRLLEELEEREIELRFLL